MSEWDKKADPPPKSWEEIKRDEAASSASSCSPESRSRRLLREMIDALDNGDEVKYFACFEALQTATLEILEGENV